MSRRLTDEEIAARYSQQYRVEAPEAGLSELGGTAVDRMQAKGYGYLEPLGLSRDYRLAQEAEAERTSQRYFDTNPNAVGSYKNISGIGDAGRYAAELGVQSLPEMLPVIGAGLVGGPAAAFGVAGLSGIGEVMQAQREQAGRTDLTAIPLGLAYGGAEAATGIVGKLAGTGIRAERAAAFANRYLDNLGGFTGGAARTGAAAGRTGLSEAAGEVGQEYITNLGRKAIDSRVELFSPEALNDYAESFVGGGLLGGLLGGAAGGWRRSQGFRDAASERDLTSTSTPQEPLVQRPDDSQFVTQDQTVGLQSFINQNVGITRPKRRDYAAQFKAAYDEPTGQFVNDPETGIERPLTVGEALQRSQAPLDMTQEKPADAAATAQVVAATVRDPRSYELRDTFGVIPTPSSLQLYSELQASGIPLDSDLLVGVWAYAGEKPMNQKRLEKAQQMVDAAIIESRKEAPSGTGISTVQQPAGSVGVGSPVVQGVVGNTGSPVAATGGAVQPAGTAGAPLQQAGILPSAAGQPSTPVTTGAPSGTQASQTIQTAPQGQAAAPVQPAAPIKANTTLRLNQQEKLPGETDIANIADIARMTGNDGGIDAVLEDEAGLRADQRDFTENDLNDLIDEQLGKGKNKERDRKILRGYILSRRLETEGTKGDLVKEIAATFGITEDRVRQIGNPEKLAKLAVEKGFDRNQVFDILGIESAQKKVATKLGKLDGELTRLKAKAKPTKADIARMAELDEQITRINDEVEAGDMAAAFKEAGIEGEAGEAFGNLDDAREWQKASTAGSQMAVKLVSIADTIAELKAAAAELNQLGLTQAEAAAAERVNELTAEYEAIVAGYEAKPEAEAAAPKKGKGKGKAAEKVAEEKDAAKEAEAAKFRAERAAKLQADRNGLAVGDTVKNPKLGTGVVKGFAGDGDATTVTVAFQSGQTKELSVKLAKLEKTDAVQVESPASVPVQPKAETSKAVGGQVRSAKKPAAEGKAQVPAVVLTEAEQAAQAWDVVAVDFPQAPKFADLTKSQQEDFIEFGPGNWERGDVELELTKMAKAGMKFGTEAAPTPNREPYTAKQLLAELKAFIRSDIPGRKLMVVDSVADLLSSSDKNIRAVGAALQLQGAYGVAVDGRAFLVANRIKQGSGRAKFMHEVGGHLGLDNLLTKADQDKLVNQIKAWAKKADGSLEAELALQAFERVQAAETPAKDRRSELIAYFIESAMEMGVDPTAATDTKLSGPLREWFRTLWAAFKVAARKLGIKPESMTAQDVVNLAYGAARLEINGTWHGTAAAFRNFRNKYIGSGEGATAYGWGTYLAQRTGIAKGYWEADVRRKTTLVELNPIKVLAGYQGWELAEDVISPADRSVLLRAGDVVNKSFASDVSDVVREFGVSDVKLVSPQGKQEVVSFAKPSGPEGNLMRVDTAVEGERVFDYDKPVIKQSSYVADKLMALLDPVTDDIVDRTNKDVEELTGKDLIGSGENDLGLLSLLIMDDAISLPVGQDKQFDEAVRQGKFHEAASHLLRGIGLDGIKFYDAKSRGSATNAVSFDGRRYNRDDLRDQVRKYRDSDSDKAMQFLILSDVLRNGLAETKQTLVDKVAAFEQMFFDTDKESAARYGTKFDEAKALADAKARAQRTVYQAKQLAWLNANEKDISLVQNQKMRNLIIFDDKNIFRVGAEAAADRQRMKFGKNAVPQGLIDRNIAKLPKQSQQPVKRIAQALGDLGGKYLDYAVFTNELVKRAQALGLGAAKTFADRLAARNAKVSEEERKIEKIADGYALIEDANKGSGPSSVNEFLFESTRTSKWGYGKYRDAKMGAAFDALGPKAQQFVKDVFAHGDAMLSSKKRIVLNATSSEYDAMIKAAQDNGDTDTEAKLKAEKAATLKRFQTLFRIREGVPYAPIKRTGAYVVIGESAAYKAAKAKNDIAAVKKLESDPDHYHVSFVDTKLQARNLSDKLSDQGVFVEPQIVKRSESFDEAFSGEAMLPALTKMRAAVDRRAQDANGKKDPSAGKLLNIINQLYLEALAEGSARKSEMRRRGVAGEVDMLHSFTQQGRADANFLASVEYEPKIQDALQQMRNQSRTGDRERKSEVFDELTQRYADSLEPKSSSFINGLTNMASKFFLASSPGYYIQNLTQPFMMSLPAMAGRHDYTKAAKELYDAYAELGPLFKDVKLFAEQFDFSKVPADVREAINDLVNQGKIDIGLATEINEYKVEADGNLSKFAQRLNKGMRLAVQKVEATNRLATAIAAYRLEFERAKKDPKIADPQAAATQYAADILTDTHGDYTAMNAPRAFNSQWGKVALQFRKFQLIQIAFYYKLFRDAFTKPDERAAAIKTLVYSFGHAGVFAGMMGIPGYAAAAFLLGLAGDEDEPYDLTADIRKAIGPEWADMIMRGAPTLAGMDLSGKIGSGNMLSIMPFSDADLTTTSGQAEAFGTFFGGAALGMTSRVADGLLLMLKGDYYKGLERTMPKGVSDALKAGRQASEGMTRRNGDVILPESEVSALDSVWTAIGVPSVKQAVTYERQNRMRDVTENFSDRTTRIKNDYAKAVRQKDTDGMAEARAAWTKLQQTRQRNGLKPQPVSALLKAPQEQKAREQRTVGGVAYREGQKKLAESVVSD